MGDKIVEGVHGCTQEEEYVWPSDPLIRQRLEWFQDQKLAFMMHYGIYSEMGIMESWALSDDSEPWGRREVDWEEDVSVFKRQYKDSIKSFNPVRIQPRKWAQFAKENGFKYVIFTTKHHDGFCMFDSKYSDFKVTSPECPFHTHKYANIAKHVFDAFREEGLGIAAYFSKPDWNCPWYWAEGMEKPVGSDRYPTYDPLDHPEVWEQFVQFTQNQMLELVEDYGPLDILWLDGGQVNPNIFHQDIRMGEVAEKARRIKPDLIFADRTVGGEFENYITPEQSLPPLPIRVPWETCITVGNCWGFRVDDEYKSPRTLVHLLVNVVCRGGNLALDVGPSYNGLLPRRALQSLEGLGDWLKDNGEAIYGTRIAEPHEAGSISFTRKGEIHYSIKKLDEGEKLPGKVLIPWPHEVNKVTLVGLNVELPFEKTEEGIEVKVPYILIGSNPLAVSFKLEK